MAKEHAISHVVGSLYAFSETAEHELVSSFRENSSSDASCDLNDRNVFTIHDSREDDEVLACLVNSIRGFISAEKNHEPDLFEDKKITRISGTHPSSALAALSEKRMQAMDQYNEAPLIEHENIIRKWSPSIESKELGLRFNSHLLGRIGRLCGCRIEHANDSADMLLKADKEQDVEKGISKLERLNKMMVDEISFPRVYSFYVLEGETSVSLQIVALKDLHDKRLVSTLLRRDSPVKLLRDLCVLVLVKGSNIHQVNLKPSASCPEYRLWNDRIYDCNHVQGLIAAKTPKEPKTPIDKWMSEVTNTDVQVDAFRPESAAEVQESADTDMANKELSSVTKKPITKRARTARGNPNASNKAFIDFKKGHDDKEGMFLQNVTSFGDNQTIKSPSTGKGSESVRQPPSIEPPYMPPHAMPSVSLSTVPSMMSQQTLPSSATWNVVVRSSRSGSLVDISVPNEGCARDEATVVTANLQDNITIAKTRDIKNTMNQRKAPMQAFGGGDTALVKSFEGIIAPLLISARPRTGRVGFTVDIGRMLINQQYASSEFKNRSFKTSEFSSVLPKGRITGFEPVFTDMLTVRSAEAESILNVLMSQGRRLFQQQPISRKITYVFTCKAKDGDHIIIEYDGDGGFDIRGSEVLIGTLDWHFPKRAWDARLQLTSEKFLATEYQKQVKGIVENIKIDVSGDGQSLQLWTRTIDDLLSIESITLHRETLHPLTVYPDLLLHLTEYQDLSVRQPFDTKSIYSGSIQASNTMVKANKVWWGAKISSINARAILEENIALELGETAKWTPSDIIKKGIVGDLFAAAKEIVTHIDHIGFFNRGEGSSNARTNEKGSENTQNTSARLRRVDPGFW